MKNIKDNFEFKKELKLNFGFGELFNMISDYQESFIERIRKNIESKLFLKWEGCAGVREDGTVEYSSVKVSTDLGGGSHPKVIVDYYRGQVIMENKVYNLDCNVFVK